MTTDMLKHIRRIKATLIFFLSVTLSGAANFCIRTFKPLERSFGYVLRGFQARLSKIWLAQNG